MEDYVYEVSKDEINGLPIGNFQGDIHIITTKKETEYAIKKLKQEKILGFDTESRPSFKKGEHYPIGLIQLASETEAFLFRVNITGTPKEVKKIFENKGITKIGLGLDKELKSLKEELHIICQNCIDLEQIAKRHRFRQRGIRALAAFFLGIRISKSAQKSNWERKELTDRQVRYAATDAWVCLKIYNEMIRQRFIS
jgi:ribonuclease D